VGPASGFNAIEKRKLFPFRESNPGSLACSSLLYQISYYGSWNGCLTPRETGRLNVRHSTNLTLTLSIVGELMNYLEPNCCSSVVVSCCYEKQKPLGAATKQRLLNTPVCPIVICEML
jgi:hypothetical protein